jgi:hypothetical protein
MNIFVLSSDPCEAAQMMCDKHVCVMPKESAQMLSTVSWLRTHGDTRVQRESFVRSDAVPYRPTHVHHPCVTWVGKTAANWDWLVVHALEICVEYSKRYGKQHACESIIASVAQLGNAPEDGRLTEFAQAMPEMHKCEGDAVRAYRNYYLAEKRRFAKWKLGNTPSWWTT